MENSYKKLCKPYGQYSSRHLRRILNRERSAINQKTNDRAEKLASLQKEIPVKNCIETLMHAHQNQPPEVPGEDEPNSLSSSSFFTNNEQMTPGEYEYVHEESSTVLQNDLRSWAIKNHVTRDSFNEILLILRKNKIPNLPLDSRTLLKLPNSDKNKLKNIVQMNSGSYYHFGLQDEIDFMLKLCDYNGSETEILHFSINIDGLPLTKSSSSQFWPILGHLDNIETSSPFPIGIYHGTSKPDDVNEFLKYFVEEYVHLGKTGLHFRDKMYHIRLSKISCDAPAKSFILNVKSHNAYFGCTKCIVEGDFIKNRMTYPHFDCALRKDEDVFHMVDEDYHKGYTLLSKTEIGLVSQIPLDYMHLVCLGVMKKLLIFWIKGNQGVRLFKEEVDEINQRISSIRQSTPKEFVRKPRSLAEIDRWKATEFRQFLLYYGPVLMYNFLKEPFWSHFLSLHCAFRILTSDQLSKSHIDYAEQLLLYFVSNFSQLYGMEYVNHNIHNLIHLCDDVRRYGKLDKFSCFKFENYMCTIKKTLNSCRYPLQQFVNRINEYKQFAINNEKVCTDEHILSGELEMTKIENKFVITYKNVVFKRMFFSITQPNCYCLLDDGFLAQIVCIFKDDRTIYIQYKQFSKLIPYFNTPCSSLVYLWIDQSFKCCNQYLCYREDMLQSYEIRQCNYFINSY